jgi:hypothetical protein
MNVIRSAGKGIRPTGVGIRSAAKGIRSLGIIVFLSLLFSGCSIGGGGKTTIIRPTIGQEMIDLEKAVESGAISEQEYIDLRQKILRRSR